MRIHRFVLSCLAAVLVNTPVLAQPSQPAAPPQHTDAGGLMTKLPPDQWLASNLEGLDVYSSNNGDKIGDITVQAVVIGIGGYLGIGKRDIAVPFDQLKFVNEPRVKTTGITTGEARSAGDSPRGGTVASSAATGTVAMPAGPTSAATSNAAPSNAPAPGIPGASGTAQVATTGSSSTPNHAVLMMNVTKDELRSAPGFRYPR